MLDHSAQAGQHSYAERGLDLYETPSCATETLLHVEKIPYRIWEPAAGRGAIVDVLKASGRIVFASDLIDYGRGFAIFDFLSKKTMDYPGIGAIVTNPPYKFADEFVRHAIKLCPKVYMLLRLAFYESERRRDILENCGLARIHVFRKRLPMMHRDGWAGNKANSAMAFAWYCWDRSHDGPTTIDRISWEA